MAFTIDKNFSPPPTGEKRTRVLKLIEELRSGKREKFVGLLRGMVNGTKECFCFEGVVGDVYIEETGSAEWTPNVGYWSFKYKERATGHVIWEDSVLPPMVWEWFGMQDGPQESDLDGDLLHFWNQYNDGCNLMSIAPHSFEEFADALETWLE